MITEKIEYQETIILIKDKIRNELKIAINKERYLNEDDAKLIGDFLSKILKEINIK